MNLIQRTAARVVKGVSSIFALDSPEARAYLTGANRTYTGRCVTPESALESIAALACVRLISQSEASLPLHIYKGGGPAPERVSNHWLQDLMDAPNPEMSGADFRTAMSAGMETRGNAYAKKVTRDTGETIALWPFAPGAIKPKRRDNGDLFYADESKGGKEYGPNEIFHLRGFSLDGVNGLSVIQQCRQGVGLALATEEYGARFFGQGAKPSVVLESAGKSTVEQRQQILDSWREHYGGMDNAHSVALAEGGLKVHVVSIPPEDAQFLETRGFNDEQIARMFGVPPHMIGLVAKSTSWGSGIEQMSIGYVIYTLLPRLDFWEKAISRSLLTAKDRIKGIYAKHEVKGLLRGDVKSRYEAYDIALRGGWINRDEVRGWEELPPIPGGGGQIFTIQSQNIPLEMAGKVNQSAPQPNQ